MGYELRSRGFSRVVCQLSQNEVDAIRTALTLLGEGAVYRKVVDTFKADFGVPSYLNVTEDLYIEGRPDTLTSEEYERIEDVIQPMTWVFNFTKEIPF